ncbi:putative ankyrin repeat-containing domain, PGG domain, ankyrin repeat-containing domain superfamily [Helianthus annuus]|nr:putative ankyrin repeat-containing domain, PGG domain, ankyrin repeat-containing domain superfamily [Helianthus annuus]
MSTKYPIPSHVSVQSFVTVKLSDKRMYGLWKTQMLCLLMSHDMLGFINGTSPAPAMQVDDELSMWSRLDALVQGWILGSLSEEAAITVLNRLNQHMHVTAKHIWDQVKITYGQQEEQDEEREGCGSPCIDLNKKVKEKQVLYDAVEGGKLQEAVSILHKKNFGITESISINGNTALHIAAAYSSPSDDKFLKRMLRLTDIPLMEVRNLDGSTPLHLAASLGNANAAKILLETCPDLLHAKDNQGCTPLDIIRSRPLNKDMCHLLKSTILQETEQAYDHEPLVVTAISYRHFDLARTLIQRCNNSLKSPAVLMAIAQNCPADFTTNQLIIYELLRTSVLSFITRDISDMKGCSKLAIVILRAVLVYTYKMLIRICLKLQVFKDFKELMEEREDAIALLDAVCNLIRSSNESVCYRKFYKQAMLEAIRRDASNVVAKIVYWFPDATLIRDEDCHNFAQAAWKNRASKIYALILDRNLLAKHTSLSFDSEPNEAGNNFLHFAARLEPARKLDLISCPPFRMQRELQWFKVAQEIIPQGRRTEENYLGETPEMIFTKEHKGLVIESGEWLKKVSNSATVAATLVLTALFAGVTQVPGGTGDNGVPHLISQPAFCIYEILITISAAAASLSLLMFMLIQGSPLTQDDFLHRLPLALVIGWVSLFVSVALGMFAFGAALFLIFGARNPWVLGLVAPIVALPISLFFLIYSWFILSALADFWHSTRHLWYFICSTV